MNAIKSAFQLDPMFMWGMSLLLILILIFTTRAIINYKTGSETEISKQISLIKSLGLFALMCSILYHLIGFYRAFDFIEQVDDLSPEVFYGGLKYSLVFPIYGLILFLTSLTIAIILSARFVKRPQIE